MRSDDAGISWMVLTWPGEKAFSAMIVVDPRNERRLWLSSMQGVVESADAGVTWRPAGDGLPAAAVNWIAIDAAGLVLHAGLENGGVWELPVGARQRPARR